LDGFWLFGMAVLVFLESAYSTCGIRHVLKTTSRSGNTINNAMDSPKRSTCGVSDVSGSC